MRNWVIGFLIFGLIGMGFVISGCQDSLDFLTTTTTLPATTITTATTSTSTSTTTTTVPSYSIFGGVKFVATSDGIKGGVDILVTASPTLVATTSADPNSGAYEVSGLSPGTYTLIASKDGWTIPSIIVEATSASQQNQDFSAEPSGWEVLRVGGGETLTYVSSMSTSGNLPGTMFAAGGGSSTLLGAGFPYTYTNWSDVPSNPTTDALIYVRDWGTEGIGIIDRAANVYVSTDEAASFVYSFTITNETLAALELYGAGTAEAVTESGKLIRIEEGLAGYSDFPTLPAGHYNDVVSDGTIIEVAGNGGICKISADGGSNWSDIGNISDQTTEDLMAINLWGTYGIITTSNGSIFITSSSGESWNQDLSGVPYPLNGIFKAPIMPSNLSGMFVVGGNGLIMRRKQ